MCERLSMSEQLLREALLEVLTEEVNQVPDEARIKRIHRFSKGFKKGMRLILRHYGMEEEVTKKSESRKTWLRFIQPAAACLLAGAVICGLYYTFTQTNMNNSDSSFGQSFVEDGTGSIDPAEEKAIEKAEVSEDAQMESDAGAFLSGSINDVLIYLDADSYNLSDSMQILVENTSVRSVEVKSGTLEIYQDGVWTSLAGEESESNLIVPSGENVSIPVDLSRFSIPDGVTDAAYILQIDEEFIEVYFNIIE